MRIAIQAADLDADRIDGTRVYILNLLRRFGGLASQDEFYIYHKNEFNPELIPPNFPNYKIKKIMSPFLWTQTRFAWELLKDKPDVLWMPMHNIPLMRSKKIKTVVTVHDLAYKYFPDYFPKRDLFLLNMLGDMAIKAADKLIAISESTKRDILKFYPAVKEEKIKVIHHGFDADLFQKNIPDEEKNKVLSKFKIQNSKFILYSGAIQPRKNLGRLIEAFEILKKSPLSNSLPKVERDDLKLVLAGEKAWLWKSILAKAESSPFRDDIIITGKLKFGDLSVLTRSAEVYAYPSLYEGFGMPIIEAFASQVPVISSNNSSLIEVGGKAAIYFNAENASELAEKIEQTLRDDSMRSSMISRGLEQIKKFSWEKCANETLDWMKS